MQLINVLFLASAALGGIIPVGRDARAAFMAFPAVSGWGAVAARDTAGQVLKPENFAHVQQDRRKAQQNWERRSA